VKLPLDNFQVLGVSPGSSARSILMILQRRLEKPDYHGFSEETIKLRSELLKEISKPLLDTEKRKEFEISYQNTDLKNEETRFLNIPNSHEIAGLLLLLESRQFEDCLGLAHEYSKKSHRTNASDLRSLTDLSILVGHATLEYGRELKSKRYYEYCARILEKGLNSVKNKAGLTEIERAIRQELEEIIPFRILDLLSRDTDEPVRELGIELLNDFVMNRGGLDGESDLKMEDLEFKSFFRQIRYFLTVQEQIDLYHDWYRSGSGAAGFLLGISLVAYGFARRKPERLVEALEVMKDLSSTELKEMISYISLLLGKVENTEDPQLFPKDEIKTTSSVSSENRLGQLCSNCREWLERDVLEGYRDLEADPDLETYFNDRDVTSFIERQDNVGIPEKTVNKILIGSIELSNRFLNKSSNQKRTDMNNSRANTKIEAKGVSKHLNKVEKSRLLQRKWILGSVGLTVTFLLWLSSGNRNSHKQKSVQSSETEAIHSSNLANRPSVRNKTPRIQEENTKTNIQTYPDETYLASILSKWLEIKTQVLSGSRIPESIRIVGTTEAIEQLKAERREDKLREETQKISAQLIDLKIISRLPDRIEVNATLSYSDERLNQSSDVIERTLKHVFKKRYILVNRDSVWQVL
jgi:hypothetical protein